MEVVKRRPKSFIWFSYKVIAQGKPRPELYLSQLSVLRFIPDLLVRACRKGLALARNSIPSR